MLELSFLSNKALSCAGRLWQAVLLSIIGVICCLFATETFGNDLPIKFGVAYITDDQQLHNTAFFVGNRGYLLTAFSKQENIKIGDNLKLKFWNPILKESVQGSVAVIDLSAGGIALLRLTNVVYQFNKAIIPTEMMSEPNSLELKQLTMYYMLPKYNQPQEISCNVPELIPDGRGNIKIQDLGNDFKDSMVGAPVFHEGHLIGIVRNNSSIHPINHAIPYVTMAESSIIGKKMIRTLVGGMTETKRLSKVIEELLITTAVVPRISRTKNGYYFRVEIEKPFGEFMYDPYHIAAIMYPTWSYPKFDMQGRETVSWKQTRDRRSDSNLEIKFNEDRVRKKELSEQLTIKNLEAVLAKDWHLNASQHEKIEIEKLMVDLTWKIKRKGDGGSLGKVMEQKKSYYLEVEEER